MAVVKSTYVTKYDAGGTGDNVIPDGYIKSVCKIWQDTYVFTSAIPSNTFIDIAKIPENKKIVAIDLNFPSLSTGAAATGTTISIGARIAAGTSHATLFLNAGEASTGIKALSADNVTGLSYVTSGGVNTIQLHIGRIATTTTAGTIKSVVYYT